VTKSGTPTSEREGYSSRLRALDNPGQVVSADRLRHSLAVLKALRPHQWVKNLLVFVPLLASHQYGSQQSVTHAVLAAIAFSDGVGRLPAE
jgi:hypothetical protein